MIFSSVFTPTSLLRVLSAVIEEVHSLMRQRESAAIVQLLITVLKSHYLQKCISQPRLQSVCTVEGHRNANRACQQSSGQEDVLYYNKSDFCASQAETGERSDSRSCDVVGFRWLAPKLPLFYKQISQTLKHG